MILPAYLRTEYHLTVDVMQGAKIIRTYTYHDHMNTWIEVALLPAMPFFLPRKTEESIRSNILMNFVHDFASDLKSSALLQSETYELPERPSDNNAIIYVVRPSAMDQWGVFVFQDDKEGRSEIGFNRGSQYISFYAEPGKHTIYSTKNQLGDRHWDEITIEVKGGETVFIRQDEKINQHTCCNLKVVDLQEGIYHVRNSRPGTIMKKN